MAVAIIALAGCHKSQDLKVAKGGEVADKSAQALPTGSAGGTETGKTPPSGGAVPVELQNDAYHYYGLGNPKPMPMEMKVSGGKPTTGTQSIEYTGVRDGKAIFMLRHTGGLAELGDNTLSLEKDGLYSIATSIGKGGDHEIELPASLKIGTTWPVKSEYTTSDGRKISTVATFKVVRNEKVTVPGGTYDALFISSDGTAVLDKEKVRMVTLNWYVKDHGLVKTEIITINPASKAKSTYLIQETK